MINPEVKNASDACKKRVPAVSYKDRELFAAIQFFIAEGIVIRWVLAIPFFLLFGILAVGHLGSIIQNFREGKAASFIPFLGGISGVIGLAILDWKLALCWFWIPLYL